MADDLLPHVFSQNAAADPEGIFARIPVGLAYQDGFQDVTKAQMDRAINRAAHLIEKAVGKSEDFRTIAYIGPNDIRYSILLIASIKTGHKLFLPSPRNSIEAHLALLSKVECTVLLTTNPQPSCVPGILDHVSLEVVTLPPVAVFLGVGDVEDYPYERDSESARHDPIFVLHTSGSTGVPKPMTYTNEFVHRAVKAMNLAVPSGYKDCCQYLSRGTFFSTLPAFHVAGVFLTTLLPAFMGSRPVYTVPGPPPTTLDFLNALDNTEVDWAIAPPVVIDEIGKHAALLDRLKARVKYVFYTGGACPKASGDIVASKLPLWGLLGSSECGAVPLMHLIDGYDNATDWQYLQVNPAMGLEWRHHIDNQYELIVKRSPELEDHQPVFCHFPEASEFATRDLFLPHPSKKGLYIHQSRVDDVIVFLNGEKTNPITFEETILSNADVKAALVVGAQRFEAGLLVELTSNKRLSEADKAQFIDRLWPTVQIANKATPAHARVAKNMILLVDPDVPMVRAGKGTVKRDASLALYAAEIDQLYNQVESQGTAVDGGPSQTSDDIRSIIRGAVAEVMNWDDINFFDTGMDSLGALRLQRALRQRLPGVSLSTIYSSPTVDALTQTLQTSSTATHDTDVEATKTKMGEVLHEYIDRVDRLAPQPKLQLSSTTLARRSILLTGSTGALGTYLLDCLLSDPETEHVYCFNRSADAGERQVSSFKARRIDAAASQLSRVTFLHGDLAKSGFGLQPSEYKQLTGHVSHILHNAWPVNFNLPLASFSPSLDGVLGVVGFANGAAHRPSILFVSSISAVSAYEGLTVPEQVATDLSAAAAMGYGQSKYITERMLAHATEKLGIPTTSVRVGQIAGAARTASGWNRQEWFPSLVVSSAHLEALPLTIGTLEPDRKESQVNWVPIDHVAKILVEILQSADVSGEAARVRHIVHPQPVPWTQVAQQVKATLDATTGKEVRLVPYSEWLDQLRESSTRDDDKDESDQSVQVRRNPAVKLMDFFEALLHEEMADKELELTETLRDSTTLSGLPTLKDEWVDGWVKEWLTG